MGVKLCPDFWAPQVDANAATYSGAKLFCYASGGSTKQDTYTDSTGNTAQTNPIILNTKGVPDDPPWLTEGITYKFVLAPSTDTDPPTSPIDTWDVISGINDVSVSLTLDQWTASGFTPTFISTTQFSVTGDQTATLHVGRRLKITQSSGTVYASITVTAFSSVTTVTAVVDSAGVLDSGISAVSYGVMTAVDTSFPVGVLHDDDVSTSTIQDNAVTLAKMAGIAAGKVITGDSSGDPQVETYLKLVDGSAQDTSTGATSYEWTSLPTSIMEIKITLTDVSLSGTNNLAIEIGDSGGYETASYSALSMRVDSATLASSTANFPISGGGSAAADLVSGWVILKNVSGNTWVISGGTGTTAGTDKMYVCSGTKTLSAALDKVKLRSSGSDTFDSGTALLSYYGNQDI